MKTYTKTYLIIVCLHRAIIGCTELRYCFQVDRSPLHLAAERGNTGIVELLVDKLRANVSARTKDGSTLMHISSQFGHPDTAMAFLRKGVPMLMPNKVCILLCYSHTNRFERFRKLLKITLRCRLL